MLAGLAAVWEESQKCYVTEIDWFIGSLIEDEHKSGRRRPH